MVGQHMEASFLLPAMWLYLEGCVLKGVAMCSCSNLPPLPAIFFIKAGLIIMMGQFRIGKK